MRIKNILGILFVGLAAIAVSAVDASADANGHIPDKTIRLVYSGTNVGTVTWVSLTSIDRNITRIEIFDSSEQTLELGVGASGAQVRRIIVLPGGNGNIPAMFFTGDNFWIRAISGTANTGELDINFYQ